MTSPERTLDEIDLRYSLERGDWLAGFAAQFHVVRRPRVYRWPMQVTLLALVVLLLLLEAVSGAWSFMGVVLPVVLAGSVVLVRMPRLLYASSVRRIVSANPALAQPIHAVLAATGVRIMTATSDTTVAWSHFPCHVEAPTVFALLGSDRLGGAVHVLPKRGLSDADTDRLRVLLAAHSRRLG